MNTLTIYAERVNRRLEQIPAVIDGGRFEIGEMPWLLSQSMRYSLSAGGKRLRPCMLLAAVDMLGGDAEDALDFACAVEMIHTYSLIHDDLPGMDDDTLRRGRPTNHVVFGQGQAILAGDGLLNSAFETMLNHACAHPEGAARYLSAIREIATGAGVGGMIGGQVMDLYCERSHEGGERALEYIQYGKTACMFIYPLRAAARLCEAPGEALEALTDYGRAFGLLFQATDDLLDVTGTQQDMGKTLGKDAQSGKLTCVSVYGLEGARARVDGLHAQAIEALKRFGRRGEFFRRLVDDMVTRTK
ncbi:MAG: polyprenyl synthetase family protein [Clostridia bacterium]|nr:polyprenyl synthetase family protein [Clostridia bacterium]